MYTRFGEGLLKKDRMPQEYKRTDPHPEIPFLDDRNVVEFDWLEYIIYTLIVAVLSSTVVIAWTEIWK